MPNPTGKTFGLRWRYNASGNVSEREFDTPLLRALYVIMLAPYATVIAQW